TTGPQWPPPGAAHCAGLHHETRRPPPSTRPAMHATHGRSPGIRPRTLPPAAPAPHRYPAMNQIALPAPRDRSDARNDRMFRYFLVATVVFVLLALAGAALSMLWGGRQALQLAGLDFFFSADWNPVENRYGALVPIYGTIVTAIIAMAIAVPVSYGIAFFLTEVAPRWLRTPVGTAIELLAGIPSIIYGMWGLFVLVPVMTTYATPWANAHLGSLPVIGPMFQGPPIGIGMLTAGIVLAIMVIPFIAATMREV